MTEAEKLVEEVARSLARTTIRRALSQVIAAHKGPGFEPSEEQVEQEVEKAWPFHVPDARAAISVTLSAVDSKLDDLLARYPSAVTEWSAAVREIRRSLFPSEPR